MGRWLGRASAIVSGAAALGTALFAGAVIGLQRELVGQPAGIRTHMLVAMGTTLFVVAASGAGMDQAGVSRVVQGIATGIGFLGAGTILKLAAEREIHGLTTAAGIWMTAAIGVAIGLGRSGAALMGIVLAWVTLAIVVKVEAVIAAATSPAPSAAACFGGLPMFKWR